MTGPDLAKASTKQAHELLIEINRLPTLPGRVYNSPNAFQADIPAIPDHVAEHLEPCDDPILSRFINDSMSVTRVVRPPRPKLDPEGLAAKASFIREAKIGNRVLFQTGVDYHILTGNTPDAEYQLERHVHDNSLLREPPQRGEGVSWLRQIIEDSKELKNRAAQAYPEEKASGFLDVSVIEAQEIIDLAKSLADR